MKTSPCTKPVHALYPGSFDPFTRGHHDIVTRALRLFAHITIGIGINPDKQPFMPVEDRLEWIRAIFSGEPRVDVISYSGLTIDAAAEIGADTLLRGVRSAEEFGYELNLAQANRNLSGIETVLLPASPELAAVSSSHIRELLGNHLDATAMFPDGAPLHLLP